MTTHALKQTPDSIIGRSIDVKKLIFLLFFIPYLSFAAESLDAHYDVGDDTQCQVFHMSDSNYRHFAQSFTTSAGYQTNKASLLLVQNFPQSGNLIVSLKAVDGSGLPTGGDLASATFAADTVSSSPAWVDAVWDAPYTLSASTKYALVLTKDTGTGNTEWRCDSSSPTYSDGSAIWYFTDAGGRWTNDVGVDMLFRIYATDAPAAPPPAPTPPSAPPPAPVNGTINVVKTVINDNGGTKTVADFPLFVNGMMVASGLTNSFPAPAPAYAVTEKVDPNYVPTFSGNCDSAGLMNLNAGDNKFCIITNDDIGAPLTVPPVPPLIDVVKVASPLVLPAGPGSVTYTYTLRNIGTVPASDVTMVGDTCTPITLVFGDANFDAKLDVNETWVYTCRTDLTKTHTNTVVATAWANGISAVDIASTMVVVGAPLVPPLIHVTKVPSPLRLFVGGGLVTYTESVTNPGTVPLTNVRVTDDKCGPVEYIFGDTNGDSKLDITETWIYICRTTLGKTTTNTVTALGEANGLVAQDFAVATVVVATALGFPNTGLSSSAWGQQVRTISISLGKGSGGPTVMTLQQFLISQNKGPEAGALAKAGATAYFGGLTRAALAEFQANVGINPALGYFGPITRAYLSAHF